MMNWVGVKNGELIALADKEFDCFITIDKNLRYQQNLDRVRMSIVLLEVSNNRLGTILEKSDKLNELLNGELNNGFFTI